MVKHIVMWKLKENANGNSKEANAKLMKEKIESLKGKISGINILEVGFNFSKNENHSDVVLYSEFKSKEDLDNYQIHPLHKALIPFIMETTSERRLVDYETV